MTVGHVFVSHSSDNRELASELAAYLEKGGARVWIAPRDVRPGKDYSEQLQGAIEECIAFVVLVTDAANTSPYVRAETEMAFSTNKPIFPVRLSDVQPASGLAFFLKIRHWTDAYGAARQANIERLLREIRALSGLTTIGGEPATTQPPTAAPEAPTTQPPAPATTPPTTAPPTTALPTTAPPTTAPPTSQALVEPVPAPPPPPPPPQPLPTTTAEEEPWRTAIGPRADFYLGRWRQMEEKGISYNWNWASCLLSLFWFAYRKMWLPLGIFIVANIVVTAIGAASPEPTRVTLMLTIGLTFVTGYFGNHWYRKHVGRLVAEAEPLDRAAALEQLARKGGVSVPAVAVLVAITLAFVAVSLVVTLAEIRRQQEQQNLLNGPPGDDSGDQGDKPVGEEEQPPVVEDQPGY